MAESIDKYARARANIANGTWSVDPERGVLTSAARGPLGHENAHGYMVVAVQRPLAQVRVHRVIYEAAFGPIPDGLTINHKNGVKTDNRIANLEAVTTAENIRHAIDTGLRKHGGTTCIHGHPFDEANTWISKRGWRMCRTCGRERQRRRAPEPKPRKPPVSHCRLGHPLSGDNLYTNRNHPTHRICRTCNLRRQAETRRLRSLHRLHQDQYKDD